MSGDNDHRDRTLAKYRPYLVVLAEAHLRPRLRKKLDASDLVQDTLLRAWQGWSDFRGDTEAERIAWLQTILGHVLDDAIRAFRYAEAGFDPGKVARGRDGAIIVPRAEFAGG